MNTLTIVCRVAISVLLGFLWIGPWGSISIAQQVPTEPGVKKNPIVIGVKVHPRELLRGERATEAPPNHVILSNTLNGWQFVPKELKREYDATLEKLESLQLDVDSGSVSAQEAMDELAILKGQLLLLRAKVDASRVHVEGAKISEQTESIEFSLGPEKRLAFTANQVRIVGWEETFVKVELRKIVLSVDDQPVEDQLKAIRIVHQHGPAAFAGRSDSEWDASEAEFLNERAGDLTEEQLIARGKLVAEIRRGYEIHRELVGKDIDQLSVAGLDYQSNPMITTKVSSEGGDGQWGSVRQRYAELTVYVPACESVSVRGAKRGLIVENLVGSLTIVEEDSTDSDARGRFEIQGVTGDVRCRSFPLHLISNVKGHVSFECYSEFGVEGMGTSHRNGMREMTPSRQFKIAVRDVTDGVDVRCGRVSLELNNIGGKIDVENDFGDTRIEATDNVSDVAHRIVSKSGRIEAYLSTVAWNSVPVVAATNYGGVRTNVETGEFSEFHLSGPDKETQVRRDWTGFHTAIETDEPFPNIFNLLNRLAAIITGEPRSAGLDIISSSGRVVVVRNP